MSDNTSNETNLQPPSTLAGYVPPIPGKVPGPADLQLALTGYAQRELAQQAWWRKSSNTVTTAAGGLVTLGTWIATTQTGAPSWITYGVGVLALLLQVVGVKNTKNGFTMQGAAKIQQAVLDPVVLGTVQKVLSQEPFPMHVAEAEIDKAKNRALDWIAETQNGSKG